MTEAEQLYVWEAYDGEKWYTIGWVRDPLWPATPLVMRHKDQADKMRRIAEAHHRVMNHPVRLAIYAPVAVQPLPDPTD